MNTAAAEILLVLYREILKQRPGEPAWPDRDRFVLGNPSAWPAHAAILRRTGYAVPDSSPSEPPPDPRRTCGVDYFSPVRGTALGVSVGLALGFRLDRRDNGVVVLLDKDELDASGLWSSAAHAGREKLNRLCAAVESEQAVQAKAAAERFLAFGWESAVVDGHNPEEIRYALGRFKKNQTQNRSR